MVAVKLLVLLVFVVVTAVWLVCRWHLARRRPGAR